MRFFKNIVLPSFQLARHQSQTSGHRLVVLLFLQTLLDLLSVASIFPLAIAIVQPEFFSELPWLKKLISIFPFSDDASVKVATILVVSLFFLVKHITGVHITRNRTTFAFGIATKISKQLIEKNLHQSYNTYYQQRASGELINVVHLPAAFAQNIILALTTVLIETFVLVGITVMILTYNARAFFFLGVLSLPAILYYRAIRQNLSSIGSIQKENYPRLIERVLSAFDCFLEINIYQKSKTVVHETDTLTERLNKLQVEQATHYSNGMRFFETTAALGLCVMVIYLVMARASTKEAVFLIGIYSAAGIRAVPSINRIIAALFQIKTNEYVVTDISTRLNATANDKKYEEAEISFLKTIEFKNVLFAYEKRTALLNQLNFSIAKGSKLLITGKSGSGKSTILLLLMGFLRPQNGVITIDGEPLDAPVIMSWQKNLSYVPQNPVLVNGSILMNIAFENSETGVDEKKIEKLVESLGMESWLQQLPDGLHTTLGERGLQISGGQRQRLAIARALYMNRDVILLDEITSNLDEQASHELIRLITQLPQTVILITHDETLRSYFDHSLLLEEGKLRSL
ncbi:MAG: ABC transporter ATP-binding protein [Cytophagales bacterium]|jgi:ABC-type bacteriocin/lantibiotic exporter with double-glycine peptidase domain|nr:ABC transporter ATP-binding protein [Cytophagales bacterium]MCA6386314.1 ABC transporter ATP-binding protein [Cytophagales bacterium]MCA6391511.1 ABC transporter ATP-binding protein [Cytophagales bacterium]MCA6396880.1 ABC transporter ATP-binding protein [Cytophagales bacterium]MCA6399179.1 ABC transporter ATP-binding protein [Cytophagales bacterium]